MLLALTGSHCANSVNAYLLVYCCVKIDWLVTLQTVPTMLIVFCPAIKSFAGYSANTAILVDHSHPPNKANSLVAHPNSNNDAKGKSVIYSHANNTSNLPC